MITTTWGRLLAVALVTMGISHTIARERIFAPLRDRLGGKETWLGYLVSCPYCLSHWVAAVLVPLTGTYAIDVVPSWGFASRALRWALSSILIAMIAAFLRVLFYFVDETQGLVRREQRSVEEEVAAKQALRENVTDWRPRTGSRA
jgi:hypothetical protein